MDGIEIEVVGGLVEDASACRMAEEGLGEEHADFLAALQFAHFALVEVIVGNVQALEQDGGVAFGGVAVFIGDDAFEFAEAHAVFVGHLGLVHRGRSRSAKSSSRAVLVAHDDGVDDAELVEGELVLAEDAEFSRTDDVAFLRLELAGQDLHEGGFAGTVGAGQAIATAGRKGDADVFKENLGAVPHGYIADTDHLNSFPIVLADSNHNGA